MRKNCRESVASNPIAASSVPIRANKMAVIQAEAVIGSAAGILPVQARSQASNPMQELEPKVQASAE